MKQNLPLNKPQAAAVLASSGLGVPVRGCAVGDWGGGEGCGWGWGVGITARLRVLICFVRLPSDAGQALSALCFTFLIHNVAAKTRPFIGSGHGMGGASQLCLLIVASRCLGFLSVKWAQT